MKSKGMVLALAIISLIIKIELTIKYVNAGAVTSAGHNYIFIHLPFHLSSPLQLLFQVIIILLLNQMRCVFFFLTLKCEHLCCWFALTFFVLILNIFFFSVAIHPYPVHTDSVKAKIF